MGEWDYIAISYGNRRKQGVTKKLMGIKWVSDILQWDIPSQQYGNLGVAQNRGFTPYRHHDVENQHDPVDL